MVDFEITSFGRQELIRQFQKKKPKSDNFYGSLFTIREAEDRVREREREYYSSLVRSPESGRVIDPNRAQRLINQGRVSLKYPRDNSKGSPLSARSLSLSPYLLLP